MQKRAKLEPFFEYNGSYIDDILYLKKINNNILTICNYDDTNVVQIWKFSYFKKGLIEMYSYEIPNHLCVSVSNDDKYLVYSTRKSVSICYLLSGKEKLSFDFDGVTSCYVSSDQQYGQRLAIYRKSCVEVWSFDKKLLYTVENVRSRGNNRCTVNVYLKYNKIIIRCPSLTIYTMDSKEIYGFMDKITYLDLSENLIAFSASGGSFNNYIYQLDLSKSKMINNTDGSSIISHDIDENNIDISNGELYYYMDETQCVHKYTLDGKRAGKELINIDKNIIYLRVFNLTLKQINEPFILFLMANFINSIDVNKIIYNYIGYQKELTKYLLITDDYVVFST
jgi:hypothetical protein